ncbi:hypothetical protein N657DRAFT_681271 [Parathielavia appendiculata]|uniref:Uncharacterized protein n=1 Tax=Parathielavia appendiculata TaxID=2587402 RepID=A0AAN6TZH4_9PEZI|nr:hypothetical protein N657DRAFT_681271 [Parathielavia appendiculata]
MTTNLEAWRRQSHAQSHQPIPGHERDIFHLSPPQVLGSSPARPHRHTQRIGNPSPSSFQDTPSNYHEATPSRPLIKLTFPSLSDIIPPPFLFDATIPLIQKLVSTPSLSNDERLLRLSDILSPCTKAICVSRLKLLLSWPALQSAWAQFVQDVLEYHANPIYALARDPHRFSSFLNLSSGNGVLAVGTNLTSNSTKPATAANHPKWRVRRKPSPLKTAMSNIWRAITGIEPARSTTTGNYNNNNRDYHAQKDMGLPSIPLVARKLLAGMNQSQHPPNLQHTCPVNGAALSQWTSQPNQQRWHMTDTRWDLERGREECTVEDYYARFVLVCLKAVYATTTITTTAPLEEPMFLLSSASSASSSLPPHASPGRGQGSSSSRSAGCDIGVDIGTGRRDAGNTTGIGTGTGGMDRIQETKRGWRERMSWLRDPSEVGSLQEQTWILVHVLLFLHCEKREQILRAGEGLDQRRNWFVGPSRRLFRWR